MSKRSRDDNEMKSPAWWTLAVEWIRVGGGTIHSSLALTENRDVVVAQSVESGQVLMEIPVSCLVSGESILSTETGKLLESVISDTSVAFYNQRQDLLIALCLASKGARFKQYLGTLPPSSDYDMLPRRWKDSELQELLTGSPLLDRVVTSRVETRRDYDKIRNKLANGMKAFPSYSDFDDMLAAVTSRAFAGMGGTCDEDIAMVPLLDLCNHRRGNVTKNVSYVKTENGSVRVVASHDLDADTVLAITYGARGNAQLLFNYGFCIPDNIEPDGSSNDVLEFKAKDELPPVDLRAGPKSYTFGGFAKALEMFHENPGHQKGDDGGFDSGVGGGMDDMEAFLNECDEGEDEMGWDDAGDNDDEMEDEQLSEERVINAELVALTAMQEAIGRAKEKYRLKERKLEQALVARGPTPEHYAAILVASELRTLYLYELGIHFVRAKLTKVEPSSTVITCGATLSNEDEALVRTQAQELAQAFINIRYPFL